LTNWNSKVINSSRGIHYCKEIKV